MIRFAFYIHNHQPVGNFEHVFEHAYTSSYLPLVKALLQHSNIKFGIHNSGPLLEWIEKNHPEYFELLRELVKRGQVEILTSAYAEPILSLIPTRDAIEQIKYFTDYLHKKFDYLPKGLWLTERVWEPGLIPFLKTAGVEYTLLDNTIFQYAGLDLDELYSYFITEDNGTILKIFPISMKLRYLIPFHPIDETINYLKEEENKRSGALQTLGDDGEKFGMWPGTYDWVYNQGWLERFLNRLEQEPWIKTVLLDEIAGEAPAGRTYLPTASYQEMGEWVMPLISARRHEEMKKNLDRKYHHLIQGGYFKNFLSRYPELNIMHKRMIYVSKNIGNDPGARLALWRGQCSCAYWHGIFGGFYLPHLREAVYKNLIEADNFSIREGLKVFDFDTDGVDELVFSNEDLFLVMKTRTASLCELDDRRRKTNVLNYLGRRPEKYHQRLPVDGKGTDVKTIHEIFQSKEKDLAQHLIYDQHERGFGLDHILDVEPGIEDFRRGEKLGMIINYEKYNVLDENHMTVQFHGPIEKTIELSKDQPKQILLRYQGEARLFAVEFSLGLFGSKVMLDADKDLNKAWRLEGIDQFRIQTDNGGPIRFQANESFSLLAYPIETVSSSEAGFERNFQGIALLLIFRKLPTVSVTL